MKARRSSNYLMITLSSFVACLLVVNVAADDNVNDQKFTLDVKDFVDRDKADPEIVNLAKFAFEEHTKEAMTNDQFTPFQYDFVYKAMSKDIKPNLKRVALLAMGEDGPDADYCEAMVEVKNNIPKVIAFIQPKPDDTR